MKYEESYDAKNWEIFKKVAFSRFCPLFMFQIIKIY